MKNLIYKEAYSKALLRGLFKMKETTFKTWLAAIEPELRKVDLSYSKYSSILTVRAFKFLLSEYGFEDENEINKMIREYYDSKGIKDN